jgi:hypothetical protein
MLEGMLRTYLEGGNGLTAQRGYHQPKFWTAWPTRLDLEPQQLFSVAEDEDRAGQFLSVVVFFAMVPFRFMAECPPGAEIFIDGSVKSCGCGSLPIQTVMN